MKYNILITDILIKDFVHVYKKDFSVDCLWKFESKIDFNKYQGIVVTGGFKTDKKFLKKFKNLKIVSVFGVGYDGCLLYTSPSPRDAIPSRMPSSA